MKTETKTCKYGPMTYFADDEFIGKSLQLYGEFSDAEISVMAATVKPGDTVIDVGANIGALTIPMAKLVGPSGTVIAIEPVADSFEVLSINIIQNRLRNVVTKLMGAGAGSYLSAVRHLNEVRGCNYGAIALGEGNSEVLVCKIDDMVSPEQKVTFIKIDVEGMERDVIIGARETIKRCRPFIYVENDRPDKANPLVSEIVDLGYRLYWHRPTLFNEQNFRNNKRNVFGGICSINMICVPEELHANVDGCDEIADLRMDPQMYEREYLRTSRIASELEEVRSRGKANPPTIKQIVNVKLQKLHYANLTHRHGAVQQIIHDILEVDPENAGALTMRGLYQLQQHDWSAWPLYEMRYKQNNIQMFGGHRAPEGVKKWDGRPVPHEPVLLWCEQGFGDSFMFGRFIKEALRRCPNLHLEVQPQLYELFEISGVVPEGHLHRLGRTRPRAAWHCSLPSLPAVLGCDATMMAKYARPYLQSEASMAKEWVKGTPRLGICCKGSPKSERPYSRDIDPLVLQPVIYGHGPWVTLDQKGQFESFADTAACISSLDLVLTVDTSIAHLAGSMGKDVFLMLSTDPDWRWGLADSKTPWYPTMTIFRQKTLFDWSPVVDEIMGALADREKLKVA